jgi:hypothetical protein
MFFSEEKNQKTFATAPTVRRFCVTRKRHQ